MPGKEKVIMENPNATLNISLTAEQINQIIQSVLGPKGGQLWNVALASDYCCVDVSVGSSVAGPVSSVASSVSMPGPELAAGAKNVKEELMHNLSPQNAKINIQVPKNVQMK